MINIVTWSSLIVVDILTLNIVDYKDYYLTKEEYSHYTNRALDKYKYINEQKHLLTTNTNTTRGRKEGKSCMDI